MFTLDLNLKNNVPQYGYFLKKVYVNSLQYPNNNCSTERVLSGLKRIKNYYCSSMIKYWLNSFTMVSNKNALTKLLNK